MNGERAAKKLSPAFQDVPVGRKDLNKMPPITSCRSKFIYLLLAHKIESLNELVRHDRQFKGFKLKLLIIFNNPGTGFFVHSCHVVGLHGNHVNGNLDGHNLSPYIKIIVC